MVASSVDGVPAVSLSSSNRSKMFSASLRNYVNKSAVQKPRGKFFILIVSFAHVKRPVVEVINLIIQIETKVAKKVPHL